MLLFVSGMEIAVILRWMETYIWTLVGYAYVDGLIKGWGWPENKDRLCDIDLVYSSEFYETGLRKDHGYLGSLHLMIN